MAKQFTSRLGLTKNDDAEAQDVQDINDSFDRIDAKIGVRWIANGSTPALSDMYDGAMFQETGTKRLLTARANGSGGYNLIQESRDAVIYSAVKSKVVNQTFGVAVPTLLTNSFDSSTIFTTTGGTGILRVFVDCNPASDISSFNARVSGDPATENNAFRSGRQSMVLEQYRTFPVGSFQPSIDVWSFGSTAVTVIAIRYAVFANSPVT